MSHSLQSPTDSTKCSHLPPTPELVSVCVCPNKCLCSKGTRSRITHQLIFLSPYVVFVTLTFYLNITGPLPSRMALNLCLVVSSWLDSSSVVLEEMRKCCCAFFTAPHEGDPGCQLVPLLVYSDYSRKAVFAQHLHWTVTHCPFGFISVLW